MSHITTTAVCVASAAFAQVSLQDNRVFVSCRDLSLVVNCDSKCELERVSVRGLDVANSGGTAIKLGANWWSSNQASRPTVRTSPTSAVISNIRFGPPSNSVEETWTLRAYPDRIDWRIDRRCPSAVVIDDSNCPAFRFTSMSTWTGAILDTGGVAWCKLFDAPDSTYGVHASTAEFWSRERGTFLSLKSATTSNMALRFTRQPDGTFEFACRPSATVLKTLHGEARFLRDRQDVWAPSAADRQTSVTYSLAAPASPREKNHFSGLNGGAIEELLKTIARIGVIDDRIVGSNGWYSGYAVLHEPWFALAGIAIDDPNYTQNLARSLDYQRDHAIAADGMVKSRWAYGAGDAQPGTYDDKGFYECQWGRLMDTQPSYAINVAEQFDLSGDLAWLRGQKRACEAALRYALSRDTNNNGLVEMAEDSRMRHKASDWLDVVWASYENGFVNAQMYRALRLWSELEETLGDRKTAELYRLHADQLKRTFNRPIGDGGLWDPARKRYIYWREKDGSLCGNNLTLPVNFMAIGYGLCDDPERVKAILDQTEHAMSAQKLFCWPANIEPFTPDETSNQPFPTYENGDIFLAWAELGIRSYAAYAPEIALKYLKNVLARYELDGLAFQRYLRANQRGAGDDILANNASAVVGLYRDVYGIQPKWNRLVLDPHLPSTLNGTVLNYRLRGQSIRVGISTGDYAARCNGYAIRSRLPFGVAFNCTGVSYFRGSEATPSLRLESARPVQASILSWRTQRTWTVDRACVCSILDLRAQVPTVLSVNGVKRMVRPDARGTLRIRLPRRSRISVAYL